MSTARQLVIQTLEFDSPARIPRDLWVLPWAHIHYPLDLQRIQARFPMDIATAPPFFRQPPQVSGSQYEIGTYVDHWGCVFENIQRGVIGEVKHPLVKTWDDLAKVRPPVERLSIDLDQVNAFCRASDCFVLSGCSVRPFERMQFLRGSANLYIDLAEQPPELLRLVEQVHQHNLKELEVWAHSKVDALRFADDWGAQRALLISPSLWRSIFKPLYRDYIDLAHAHGKYIFMHSDGCISAIIPDLVELGLDALNSQLFCMDIEQLGVAFAGKLTFWGEIDRQHLLPFGSLVEVDSAVRRVHQSLYRQGGVIAQCEFSAGARPENVYQVYQSWEQVLPEE